MATRSSPLEPTAIPCAFQCHEYSAGERPSPISDRRRKLKALTYDFAPAMLLSHVEIKLRVPTPDMNEDPRCQRCDAPLIGQVLGELCANCLLELALDPLCEATRPLEERLAGSADPIRVRSFGDQELIEETAPAHPTAARFTTTLWTQVLAAPRNEKALASLCRKYRYPLYAFLRRSGVSCHEAEDLTQGFFFHLLSKQGLETVRREYGRFRSFLLASLQHFVADQRDRAGAAKRSPPQPLFELDARNAEDRYRREPVDRMNPETIFERRWALTVLEEALASLETECMNSGKGEIFRELQPFLCGEERVPVYNEVAARLGMSAGAARVTVHRLRERYRELVRGEIADTLAAGEDLEAEMKHLFAVVRNN
jgi:DNA-directed RNA polymerase specialized sigma24 family protein